MRMIIFGIALAALVLWIGYGYALTRSLEEPAYRVLSTASDYEIREYSDYLVAETEVSGSLDTGLNSGFRVIADYIFGNNTKSTAIAMTAPVAERKASEPIAMTVPVSERQSGNKRVVSFSMPSKYTLANIPRPNNPAVVLRIVPAHRVAALRFTWYATAARSEEKMRQLSAALKRDGLKAVGEPTLAQYNPPLSFPLLRRNEILIDLAN